MKALILKDFYVLWKQARIFVILVLLFSSIPGSFNSTFVVVYAAMLPYTAMAYDERSKWDQLALMMPYSDRDVVLSKYLFGALGSLAAMVLSMTLQFFIHGVLRYGTQQPDPLVSLLALCTSLCILSITLPLMFRFGVERGRLLMFLIIILVCGATGAMGSVVISTGDGGYRLPTFVVPAMAAAAALLTAVSIPLSIRLYRRQKG